MMISQIVKHFGRVNEIQCIEMKCLECAFNHVVTTFTTINRLGLLVYYRPLSHVLGWQYEKYNKDETRLDYFLDKTLQCSHMFFIEYKNTKN